MRSFLRTQETKNQEDYRETATPSLDSDLVKTMRDASIGLTRFLDKGLNMVRVVRRDVLREAYNRGIYSLPFEIMEHILQFAYGPFDDRWRNLLLVNRYFRDITCRTSHLWTIVDVGYDPAPYLERSALRKLVLFADDIFDSRVQFERWAAAIEPHVERWETFSIRSTPDHGMGGELRNLIGDPNECVHTRLCHLRDTYQGRTFPSLETLSVSYGIDVPVDHEVDVIWDGIAVLDNSTDPHASIRNFFSTWDMPALRNLDMGGFIPMLPQKCASNITRFVLELGDRCLINSLAYNLHAIYEFLRSLTVLEDLHFILRALDVFLEDDVQPVEFPRLKALAVDSKSAFVDALYPLLGSFSAPELRDLTLDVETPSADQAEGFIECLFPEDRPRFARLEKLSCRLGYEDDDVECCALDFLFKRLPPLRDLTITDWSFRWPKAFTLHEYVSSPDRLVPPLRTLCFKRCASLNLSFILKSLRDVIKSPGFEMLEIHNCPLINTEIVRKAMPDGKKLRSTEYAWRMSCHFVSKPKYSDVSF